MNVSANLICDVALLGAFLVITLLIGYAVVDRYTRRLSVAASWMFIVMAVCFGCLQLMGISLNIPFLRDLYGKVITVFLLWANVFLLWKLIFRDRRLSHVRDLDAQLEWQIVERVRVEEQLRQSESRLRTIFDNTRDVIACVDWRGRLLAVNRRVEEVFGYKPEEVVGKRFTKLGILQLTDIPRIVGLFRRTVREGRADEIVELELKHKNGSTVCVEVGTRFIRRNGRVKEVVNVFRDVTERRRAMASSPQKLDCRLPLAAVDTGPQPACCTPSCQS